MWNGLLVIIMLISSHKSLAEQLVACNVSATLKKCLSAQNQHSMLAIIALNHISMVHKLEKKGIIMNYCNCLPNLIAFEKSQTLLTNN